MSSASRHSSKLQAVLDTNVLVSGVIVPQGNSGQLLDAWQRDAFALVTSPRLIAEFERVLHRARIRRKYQVIEEQIVGLIESLRLAARQEAPLDTLPIRSRDPKDDPFLAVALAAHADYLVTGDDDLLSLDGAPALGTLRIVTVRAFLVILAA